jgi:hypothetical protein
MAGWWSIEVEFAAALPEPADVAVAQVTGLTPPGVPEPVQAGAL